MNQFFVFIFFGIYIEIKAKSEPKVTKTAKCVHKIKCVRTKIRAYLHRLNCANMYIDWNLFKTCTFNYRKRNEAKRIETISKQLNKTKSWRWRRPAKRYRFLSISLVWTEQNTEINVFNDLIIWNTARSFIDWKKIHRKLRSIDRLLSCIDRFWEPAPLLSHFWFSKSTFNFYTFTTLTIMHTHTHVVHTLDTVWLF